MQSEAPLIISVLEFLKSRKFRYLMAGGANTVFGYLIGVVTYKILSPEFSIWIVGFFTNVIAITFSFVTYKLFVFKTQGQWIAEYLKSYLVYGSMALIGMVFLWVYVDLMNMTIWMAQGLVIISTVVLSYMGHSRVTFRRKET